MQCYTINYSGTWISWNAMLSANRWQRTKLLNGWKPVYQQMFKDAGIQPMEAFRIEATYWSKHDCDNLYFKGLIDQLRKEKLVINDDRRYFYGISSTPDPTLKHNTFIIKIIPVIK